MANISDEFLEKIKQIFPEKKDIASSIYDSTHA
jgi:hypothetical protein